MSTPTLAKTYNLIAYLAKPIETEGFEQIIDFINGSSVKTINDEVRIQALIYETRVNIKESSIRRTLKLDDAEGISCLPNADIFDGLAKMGYEKLSEKLTFYKAFFSPQWKFLIHTILQCLSAKTTFWNEFSSTMASAIICLATNQKFNFSTYILLSLVKHIEVGVPFFMFPRFVQLLIDHQLGDMSHHKDIYDNTFITKKVFVNMKRVGTGFSGVVTPLFDKMLVSAAKEVGLIQDDVQSISIPNEPSTSKPHKKHKPKKQQTQAPKVPSSEPSPEYRLPSPSNDPLPGGKDSLKLKELIDLCTHLSNKVLALESEVIDIKSTYKERIEKLEGRLDRLEEENRVLKELYSVHSKVDTTAPVVEKEKSFKQRRIIADIDKDVQSKDNGKGILIEEPNSFKGQAQIEQDEAFARQLEAELTADINWNVVIEQVKRNERLNDAVMKYQALKRKPLTEAQARKNMIIYLKNMAGYKMNYFKGMAYNINWNVVIEQVKRIERLNDAMLKYQSLKRKPLTEAQARKNMIIYLKNMAGYKMNYFKGMAYSEIRHIFKKHYNYNQAFLEEVNEEDTVPEKEVKVEGHKRKGGSLEKEITKKQMMDEEAEELKSHLQIVLNDDDDVYIEGTPLASKIPIIDYKIHLKEANLTSR
nr:hypothetical protein [Tanacetum cinerariifolium]